MSKPVFFLIFAIAASVEAQTGCPAAISIFPCVCQLIEDRPFLACSQINDQDELERIFSADFPDPDVQVFSLLDSYLPILSRNVFGNVTFNNVYIRVDHLQEIGADVFENSYETLINWEILDAPLTQISFPFENLGSFTQLIQLTLQNNMISQFPSISSDSLRFLFILENPYLTAIPADALINVGNLTSLDLEGCAIATLQDTSFRGLEALEYLILRSNRITSIQEALFDNMPLLLEINLSENEITNFEIGALTTTSALKTLNMGYNYLQELNLETFQSNPELENVDFIGNNISQILPGTFDNLPMLKLVDLGFNRLSRLVTDTFRGVNVTALLVDVNVINYIEENAFGDVQESYINIVDNQLTDIYEFWLKPLLDAGNEVYLTQNPISCGCEISWLFEDPSYSDLLIMTCANGTNFADLDPIYYIENC